MHYTVAVPYCSSIALFWELLWARVSWIMPNMSDMFLKDMYGPFLGYFYHVLLFLLTWIKIDKSGQNFSEEKVSNARLERHEGHSYSEVSYSEFKQHVSTVPFFSSFHSSLPLSQMPSPLSCKSFVLFPSLSASFFLLHIPSDLLL